jgi:hypothetical protein
MYRKREGSDPAGDYLTDFSLWDIKGRWVSHEGSPDVRILRNNGGQSGNYHLELIYRTGNSYRRPIKKHVRNFRYFDLYGFVGLAYDSGRDVLQLSHYGDYYRAED